MHTIGIRDLRAGLANVVHAAARGQVTVITQHGRHAAQIGPIGSAAAPLDQLVAAGRIKPPARRDRWRPSPAVTIRVGSRVDLALRDLRG